MSRVRCDPRRLSESCQGPSPEKHSPVCQIDGLELGRATGEEQASSGIVLFLTDATAAGAER